MTLEALCECTLRVFPQTKSPGCGPCCLTGFQRFQALRCFKRHVSLVAIQGGYVTRVLLGTWREIHLLCDPEQVLAFFWGVDQILP